jgi:hypothetical protein
MKKIFVLGLTLIMIISAIPFTASAGVGNGAPSGAHYNLNIIGVHNPKTADMDDSSGHVIFVPLIGKTTINLSVGEFQVLDGNGTDGKAAFQLPNPDPTNSGTSEYSVFVRALGKPGGKADMTTGAYQWIDLDADGVVDDGELFLRMSVISLPLERTNGKQTFVNATKELLYVYVDLNGDGTAERYNLFNDALQDYFWEYDNNGLKLVQLRFYPGVQTTVPDSYPVP